MHINLKNLLFGDAPSETKACTKNPKLSSTPVASNVHGYNWDDVKPVEAKYANG